MLSLNKSYYAYEMVCLTFGREQIGGKRMILYELYWRDETGKEYFVGTLPERRKDPKRITEESILNWAKDFVGNGADPRNIYFVRAETQSHNK